MAQNAELEMWSCAELGVPGTPNRACRTSPQLLIDGKFVDPKDGRTFGVVDPRTEEVGRGGAPRRPPCWRLASGCARGLHGGILAAAQAQGLTPSTQGLVCTGGVEHGGGWARGRGPRCARCAQGV